MTNNQIGLISLVKSSITGKAVELPDGFSINDVLTIIRKHHISSMVYYGALNCGISSESKVMQSLFIDACFSMSISENQMLELNALYKAFEENGIDYMPVKGAVLKELYPHTDMRFMGDADVLIKTDQYDKIKPILQNFGFEQRLESDHELTWVKPSLCLELHKRLIPSYNYDYYSVFGDGWHLAKRCEDSQHRYEMTAEDNFIFLFTHFAKHYRDGGIGIKHLTDLWLFIKEYSLDTEVLKKRFEKLQLSQFFSNILDVLNTWFSDKPSNEMTEFISDFILKSGAYGTYEAHVLSKGLIKAKLVGSAKGVKRNSLVNAIFLPYSYMRERYSLLKKAPFLLPVMWVVRWFTALLFRHKNIKIQQSNIKILSNKKIEEFQQSLHYVGLDFNFNTSQDILLTNNQRALLSFLSAAINGSDSQIEKIMAQLTESDWKNILLESSKQTVSNLAFEGIANYSHIIPTTVYNSWFQTATKSLLKTVQVINAQHNMVKIMDENNFPYVILKGTASAAYYPKFNSRTFGDVDFLIDPKQQPLIEKVFSKSGYRRWNKEHDFHVVYAKKNELLEMHFEISGIPYGKIGDKIRQFMNGAVDNYQIYTHENIGFRVPTTLYHGLIILLHMQHHMLGEGIGLRHFCDWACFVKKTINEEFWGASLLPFLKEIGLLTYAKTMTKTAAIYLHIPCPDWASDAPEHLCFEVIRDIFESGNFGRKDLKRSQSSSLVSQHGKTGTKHGAIYNLLCKMHIIVKHNYPIIKKAPYLYPFLYIYRSTRFLLLQLSGKRESLLNLLPDAKKRRSVYEQLHVFEIE